MAGLLQGAGEFLGALLSLLGFTGRRRRRAGIREDLELLGELEKQGEFGKGSQAQTNLVTHIQREVALLTGAELTRRRKIQWGSVVLAFVCFVPLAYITYL